MQIKLHFFLPAISLLFGFLFIILADCVQSTPRGPFPPLIVPPAPVPRPVASSIISNNGVPDINLPCGWLDGRHPILTEFGPNTPMLMSQRFFLPPGQYNFFWRWTRPIRPGKYIISLRPTRLCTTRFVDTRYYRKRRSCIFIPQRRPAHAFCGIRLSGY